MLHGAKSLLQKFGIVELLDQSHYGSWSDRGDKVVANSFSTCSNYESVSLSVVHNGAGMNDLLT